MDIKPLKTLLLLDSVQEAKILRTLLSDLSLKLEIIVAESLDQFKSIVLKDQVDCFILDWKFENYSVADLAIQIRKSNKYRHTPIIMVPNLEDSAIPNEYSAIKLDMLLYRPFNFVEFEKPLLDVLNKKFGHIIPDHFEVLILDDDPDVLEINIDFLNRLEHKKYQTCSSVSEAKKLVSEKDFDLLLLDWNLADGTCIDLIEFIRSKKDKIRLNSALIIAITGRDDVDDIMNLLKFNVVDHIIKPYQYDEFEDKLIYALERHKKKG
jgi:DNA-binding response OmpR family regulator